MQILSVKTQQRRCCLIDPYGIVRYWQKKIFENVCDNIVLTDLHNSYPRVTAALKFCSNWHICEDRRIFEYFARQWLILDWMPVLNEGDRPYMAGLLRFLTLIYTFFLISLSRPFLLHTCFWRALNTLFLGGHFTSVEPLESIGLCDFHSFPRVICKLTPLFFFLPCASFFVLFILQDMF